MYRKKQANGKYFECTIYTSISYGSFCCWSFLYVDFILLILHQIFLVEQNQVLKCGCVFFNFSRRPVAAPIGVDNFLSSFYFSLKLDLFPANSVVFSCQVFYFCFAFSALVVFGNSYVGSSHSSHFLALTHFPI